MKTIARLRHLSVGPLKVRRFASTIKGEPVARAEAILDLQSSPTCQALLKLLRSAIANAQNNNGLSAEYLVVSNVMVDQGPSMKRIRPRARGRAYRVLKRSSHVTIELDLKAGLSENQVKEEQGAKQPSRSKRKPAKETSTADKATKKPATETAKKKPTTSEKKEKAPAKKVAKKNVGKAEQTAAAKGAVKKAAKGAVKKAAKTSAGKGKSVPTEKGDKGSKE